MLEATQLDEVQPFAPPPQKERSTELGQEDFLTLMITQFRNQDPFEPMDNGDFLGQLAQFGTVNGIDDLNSAFAGLQTSIQSEQALQAANLVGHRVLAESPVAWLESGAGIAGAVELPASASNVQIEITDGAGQLVRRFDLGQQPAGMSGFRWDGRDAAGAAMPEGRYFVSARVSRGSAVESAATLIQSRVDSVTLGRGQGLTLNIAGGAQLSLANVRQII